MPIPMDSPGSKALVDEMMTFLRRWGLPGHERAIARDLVGLMGLACELGANAALANFAVKLNREIGREFDGKTG